MFKLTCKLNRYFSEFPRYYFATDKLSPERQSCNSFKTWVLGQRQNLSQLKTLQVQQSQNRVKPNTISCNISSGSSPSVTGPGLASSTPPGNLLGIQSLRPHPRPSESEPLGVGPVTLYFLRSVSPCGDSAERQSVRMTDPIIRQCVERGRNTRTWEKLVWFLVKRLSSGVHVWTSNSLSTSCGPWGQLAAVPEHSSLQWRVDPPHIHTHRVVGSTEQATDSPLYHAASGSQNQVPGKPWGKNHQLLVG